MSDKKAKEIIDDLKSKGFVYNFALSRWEHPETGAYSTDEYIEMESDGVDIIMMFKSGVLPGIITPIRSKKLMDCGD